MLERPLPSRSISGFTLIEAVVSIVLVGVILVASLNVVGTTARMRHVRSHDDQGLALAHALMSEILAVRFQEPDEEPVFGLESESGGDRAEWDDIDDYHGWSASPPEDKGGIEIPGTNGWTRSVAVANVAPADLQVLGTNTPDPVLRSIKVAVTAPNGTATSLTVLRSVHGAGEQSPPADTTYVMGVGIDLVVGEGDAGATGDANLINHVIGGP